MACFSISRFASAFSVLYGGGNGIIDCMAITGRVMGNTWVERKIQEAVNGLEKGESLSAALKRQRIFHPVFLSMVAAGEESGELESVLLQAGNINRTVYDLSDGRHCGNYCFIHYAAGI